MWLVRNQISWLLELIAHRLPMCVWMCFAYIESPSAETAIVNHCPNSNTVAAINAELLKNLTRSALADWPWSFYCHPSSEGTHSQGLQ